MRLFTVLSRAMGTKSGHGAAVGVGQVALRN